MRLPNGFGSVYKLSGNRRKPYIARKTTGWNEKGHPIYQAIGYYTTQKEALLALSSYNENPYSLTSAITFEELYDKWSTIHYEKVSQSNINGCKAAFKLCAPIYKTKVTELKLSHFQHITNISGKNYPTLKKLKVLIGLIYDYAVINEIVPPEKREFIRYLDISFAGNPNAYNRLPFTKQEINKLWNIIENNEYYSVILILIFTGLRISELLELKKSDVNLEEKWLDIIESKTKAGVRRVPIANKIFPLIQSWYNKKSDNLISTPTGAEFSYYNYYDSYWKPLIEQLGMAHKPHDTRHTCISLLTMAKVDERIIKKIVGHKGQGVTQSVYTHIEIEELLIEINKI